MRSRRIGRHSVEFDMVSVEIDMSDILESLTDEELSNALRERNAIQPANAKQTLEEIRDDLERGYIGSALRKVERLLKDKPDDGSAEYERIKAGKHPFLFIPTSGPHGPASSSAGETAGRDHARPDTGGKT